MLYVSEISDDPGNDMYWGMHIVIQTDVSKPILEAALTKPRSMMAHLETWTTRPGGQHDINSENRSDVARETAAELHRRGVTGVSIEPAEYVFVNS